MLASIVTLTIILLGLSTLATIKRDNFPEVEFGQLMITTSYPGASPEDVELMVTNKIEKELKPVAGIKRYVSWSLKDVSSICIIIDPDINDENKVIREIREAVLRVNGLPSEVTESPLVTELSTLSIPVIEIGLSGDLPYRELRKIARRLERK